MRTISYFDDIFSGETDWVSFDFSAFASIAFPVTAPSVVCTVLAGDDPAAPDSVLLGAASVMTGGLVVAQHLQGAVKGVTYLLTCEVIINGERRYMAATIRTI